MTTSEQVKRIILGAGGTPWSPPKFHVEVTTQLGRGISFGEGWAANTYEHALATAWHVAHEMAAGEAQPQLEIKITIG
jgi:hypothetical protein